MYIEKDIFTSPEDKTVKVWRYIDFTKFVDLLISNELFFSCPDKFNDSFEGSLTKPTANKINSLSNNNKEFTDFRESIRQIVGINCWHMSQSESEAMWKLYLKSNEGIAIQSTFNRLANCFEKTEDSIGLSVVKYVDYETHEFKITNNSMNFYEPFVHKRDLFSHEKELRAIYINNPSPNKPYIGPLIKEIHSQHMMGMGKSIKVDLKCLVENVYISPTSSDWFKNLVAITIKKLNYDFNVVDSKLRERPSF
jgi:hypothetical protein